VAKIKGLPVPNPFLRGFLDFLNVIIKGIHEPAFAARIPRSRENNSLPSCFLLSRRNDFVLIHSTTASVKVLESTEEGGERGETEEVEKGNGRALL